MLIATATFTMSIAAIPTGRRRINSPALAAGNAVSARSSPSACGPVRARSWCWCFPWRRACSRPASPPTFVIGLGTAITVATIAVVAVSAGRPRPPAQRGSEGTGTLIMRGIQFGAAGLALLFGLGLFSLSRCRTRDVFGCAAYSSAREDWLRTVLFSLVTAKASPPLAALPFAEPVFPAECWRSNSVIG